MGYLWLGYNSNVLWAVPVEENSSFFTNFILAIVITNNFRILFYYFFVFTISSKFTFGWFGCFSVGVCILGKFAKLSI